MLIKKTCSIEYLRKWYILILVMMSLVINWEQNYFRLEETIRPKDDLLSGWVTWKKID